MMRLLPKFRFGGRKVEEWENVQFRMSNSECRISNIQCPMIAFGDLEVFVQKPIKALQTIQVETAVIKGRIHQSFLFKIVGGCLIF